MVSLSLAVGCLSKSLVPRCLKTASFFRIWGSPQSVCVRTNVYVSVNTDPVPDKDHGWRDNQYPEYSLVRSDEKVSVANLWTNRWHTYTCMHTPLEEEIESLSNFERTLWTWWSRFLRGKQTIISITALLIVA